RRRRTPRPWAPGTRRTPPSPGGAVSWRALGGHGLVVELVEEGEQARVVDAALGEEVTEQLAGAASLHPAALGNRCGGGAEHHVHQALAAGPEGGAQLVGQAGPPRLVDDGA